jgi:hypothetical protein
MKNHFTGVEFDVDILTDWDNVISMDKRAIHACPCCGLMISSPLDKPMAHKECINKLKENGIGRKAQTQSS